MFGVEAEPGSQDSSQDRLIVCFVPIRPLKYSK